MPEELSLEIPEISATDWERIQDPTRQYNSFEFGPSWWFHLPMYVLGVLWAIRLGKANYFAAANPALENGGLFGYSKYVAQNHFPQANLPKTCRVHSDEGFDVVLERIKGQGISFPFIIKPDVGERGKGVAVIHDENGLRAYLNDQPKEPYLVQDFVGKSQEYGVFFLKNPATGELSILSLTRKIPLQVVGDGISSVFELIQKHPRACRYQNLFRVEDPTSIPMQHEVIKLSPMGNHCKGAVFLDYSHYISPEVTAAFCKIFQAVEGMYYGRLDVKVDDLRDLSDPGSIIILEVNGANAEPIQIYSPEKAYREGLKTIGFYFQNMAMVAKHNLAGQRRQFKLKDTLRSLRTYVKKQ